MAETEKRDPRCEAVGCALDGRNCDITKCNLITGEKATDGVSPNEAPMLSNECGGIHGA